MTVQVQVDLESSGLVLLDHCLLGLVDGWLPVGARIQVKAVEVVVVGVKAIVATSHAVGVEQWNYLEGILL